MIAANPALQERELLKMASLGAAATARPARPGRPAEPTPRLAAQAGVAAFSLGFELWVADASSDDPGHASIDATLAELRAVTAGVAP